MTPSVDHEPVMGATKEAVMADDPTPDPTPEPDDPDAGAKKALEAERKARRDADKRAAEMEKRLKEIEDKDKSEVERLTEELAAAKQEASASAVERDRLAAAVNKGLSEDQAKRVLGAARRISGDTAEDLEADADDYFAALGPMSDAAPPAPGKPTEALRGGGDPTEEPAVDVREVVDSIPRGF